MTAAQIISTADLALARRAPAAVDEVLLADEYAPRRARALLADLDDCCLPPERMNDVLVAVSEAVTNAVIHAYPDGVEGTVHLKAWALENSLAVLVSDHGSGFDPVRVPGGPRTGLGMGTSLLRRIATRVVTFSRPGAGASVLMIFQP